MKPVLSTASLLALLAAAPALAQQQPYPADTPPAARSQSDIPTEQQAQTPDADQRRPGDVEELRSQGMSSPNVQGETVPEQPQTGVPQPQTESNPNRLNSPENR